MSKDSDKKKNEQEVEKYKALLKNDVTLLIYALLEQIYGKKKAKAVHENDFEDLEMRIEEAYDRVLMEIEIVADDLEYDLPSLFDEYVVDKTQNIFYNYYRKIRDYLLSS